MSRYNHKRKWTSKEYSIRFAAITLIAIIMVALMPRQSIRIFQYEKGAPWEYSTLIAQDSFPIFKSEERQARERDSIMLYYEPYYQSLANVRDSMIFLWHTACQNEFGGQVPHDIEKYITMRLLEIYDRGIIPSSDLADISKSDINYIRVISGRTSTIQPVSDLYNPKTAYEYILNSAESSDIPHDQLITYGLNRYIESNLRQDDFKNQLQREELLSSLTPYLGHVVVGQKIVDRGQIVDEATLSVLQSMELHQRQQAKSTTDILITLAGQFAFTILILSLLAIYFEQFRSDYLDNLRTMLLVLTLFTLFPLLTYALSRYTFPNAYILPFCMTPVFIRVFMDSRTAFIVHLLSILMCSLAVKQPDQFIVVQSIAGLTSILCLRELTQRSDLFRTVLITLGVTLLTYASTEVYAGHLLLLSEFRHTDIICLLLSSLLMMVSYLLLIPIERGFGFTSTVTLLELSNTNTPLLRKMSEEAPGTFQHSMQVANLCAAVAEKIGAKTQVVRTGALYHDIGKIRHAVFFTENQNGINPHDRFTYEQSAQVIIRHVSEGLTLADRMKLPDIIKGFIATHHGTSMTKYFYVQAQNKSPEQKLDPSLFTYPGPDPSTREQAILTMCDAVEAASHSLKEITEENITRLVDTIIDEQLSTGRFRNAPITFAEIETAKEVLKAKLMSIYHTRVQYPELKTQSTS